MNQWTDMDVVSAYTLKQALADEVLVEVFKNRWDKLTAGKPIVATAHLAREVSPAGLLEIWNEYVEWRKHTEPFLPEEERLFHMRMNSQTVWVIEDSAAFTLMYPVDY